MRLQGNSIRTVVIAVIFYAVLNSYPIALIAGVGQWTTNGPEGGDVATIAVDPSSPSTIYTGFYNGDGVYKTTDGGTTWIASKSGFSTESVHALQVDPQAPAVVYAGTDMGVFKSTNAGASWARIGLASENVRSLVLDPRVPSTIYVGALTTFAGGGVFKSTDAGATWSPASNGLSNTSVWALAIASSDPSILYAGTYQGIFKSTNSGANWVSMGLENYSIFALAVDPVNPGVVYAGSPLDGVFKSTDGGVHWGSSNIGLSSSCGPCVYALTIDSVMTNVVYAGVFAGGVFKSTDSGANWKPMNNGIGHTLITTLRIDPGNHSTVYAGTFGGGIFKSTDSGGTWGSKIGGMFAAHIQSLAVDPSSASIAYAGTSSSGIFKTIDKGRHWTLLSTPLGKAPGQVWDLAIDPSSPATVYAVLNGPPGVLKTTNAGASWLSTNSGLTVTSFSSIAIAPSAPATLYVGSFNGKIFRSNDGGANWVLASEGLKSGSVYSLAVDPVNAAVVYAAVQGEGVYKSTTSGQSWTHVGPPGTVFSISALAVDPLNPSIIYAGDEGGSRRAYKSLDAGASWSPMSGLEDVTRLRVVATQSMTLYAATSRTGVLKSLDGGDSWSIVDGASPREVRQLAVSSDGSSVYAGARYSGGVFVYTDSSIPPCARDTDTACLLAGRFEVEVDWRTASSNGSAQVMSFGGQRAENEESVFWWFFGATNFEMGVKVLNACVPSLGNKFWVFVSGLTDQGWTVRVRDTQTGATKKYENVTGQLSKTFADTAAFDCP